MHSFVSWLRELKIEGNHAPCGSDIAKESLGGTGCVPKCLRKKNFQDLSRGRPRRFYVRAQNGKVRLLFEFCQMILDGLLKDRKPGVRDQLVLVLPSLIVSQVVLEAAKAHAVSAENIASFQTMT